MRAPLATSLSVLSRSLERRLAAIKPLSPGEYLAHALAAERYRATRVADKGRAESTLGRSARLLAHSDSSKLGHFLRKLRGYRRVQRAVVRRNRKHARRATAFVAEALRQVGVPVPHDRVIDGLGVSQVTWALSRYLRDDLGWQRIDAMAELSVGDIVFSADAHCCPGIPHHVMVFMGWHDVARGQALVVDNAGFLAIRDLGADAPHHHERGAGRDSTTTVDARFGYALRACTAVSPVSYRLAA